MNQSPTLNAPTRFVTADGVTYAYRRLGADAGTPLLCLQHFTGNLDLWDPAVFDRLAERRSILLFANAGVGRSGGTTPDTVEAMAGHAIRFLEALGVAQADLLGFSLGGFIAQEMALRRPELVRRLILAGTGPAGGEGTSMSRPELLQIFSDAQMPMAEKLRVLFFPGDEAGGRAAAAYLERVGGRQADSDTAATGEVAMSQLRAMAAWEAANADRFERLHAITHPVLVTNGDQDWMIPSRNSATLKDHLPLATLILYPDSGHGALYQYPREFASHVETFLGQA